MILLKNKEKMMKWFWFVIGLILIMLLIGEVVIFHNWNQINANFLLICFMSFEICVLKDQVKKLK